MKKVIDISLSGYPTPFKADEEAYVVLRQYLDRAAAQLKADPYHEDVVRDLEQSIAEKLAVVAASGIEILGVAEVNAVLAEVGAVDADKDSGFVEVPEERPRRRLYRIKEGQQIAGVCQGLAVYSSVRVDWVRTVFFFAAALTGGVGALAYVVLMFTLPVVSSRQEYVAANQAPSQQA